MGVVSVPCPLSHRLEQSRPHSVQLMVARLSSGGLAASADFLWVLITMTLDRFMAVALCGEILQQEKWVHPPSFVTPRTSLWTVVGFENTKKGKHLNYSVFFLFVSFEFHRGLPSMCLI